jgi:hypothetical protein
MDPSVLIDIVEPAARVLLVVQRFPATDLPASGFYAEYARHVRRIEALCRQGTRIVSRISKAPKFILFPSKVPRYHLIIQLSNVEQNTAMHGATTS